MEGGDEIDLLAEVSGELVFFELKDKEFNLGNAYSFGAKIGIIEPNHPVILITEHVGNDAKDHFQRARQVRSARRPRFATEQVRGSDIRYIEGIENLARGICDLGASIYAADAVRILQRVLPFALVDPGTLVQAIDKRETAGSVQDVKRPVAAR